MRRFILILCSVFVLVVNAFAQKEASIWYFGTLAGLKFNAATPAPLFGSALQTNEGCTSVANAHGVLQFYTDGKTVWNRNHVQMANGSGLMGHLSSSQAVLALPQPGKPGVYYVFTTDAVENTFQGGFRLSLVDMAQASGFGSVTAKNRLIAPMVTERITAVRHANGRDIWVIVHKWNSDQFLAFLLTNAGLMNSPVISAVGSSHHGVTTNGAGYLKASKDGRKLAVAISGTDKFELFDFDPNSGKVYNPITSNPGFSGAYGVEFSPDGTKLYASANQGIYQFDLLAPDIFQSGIQIVSPPAANSFGALQLGPDNKIYCAKIGASTLGQINNPDAAGTSCDFADNAISLGGSIVMMGLPNIPAFLVPVHKFRFENLCYGGSTTFTIPGYSANYNISWNFNDPNSGSQNYSNRPDPSHIFSKPGVYNVTLTLTDIYNSSNVTILTEQVTIGPTVDLSLGRDTVLCEGETVLLGKPALPGVTYKWNNGSANATLLVTKPGIYWLEAEKNGCISVGNQIRVTYIARPVLNLGNDTTICSGESLLLGIEDVPGNQYKWHNGSTSSTFLVTEPGVYSLQLSRNNCFATASVKVTFEDCEVTIPNIITPNNDGLNDLFVVKGIWVKDCALQVFNRWGSRVYETDSYHNNWQAEGIAAGNYYYLLRNSKTGKTYKGWLEIVK